MKLNQKHIELFDRYINGELSKKWMQAFEEKLEKDTEFKAAFDEHKLIVAGLKTEGRKMLKKDLQSIGGSFSVKPKKYRTRSARIRRGLMQFVLLTSVVVAALVWFNRPGEGQQNNVTPTEIDSTNVKPVEVKSKPVKKPNKKVNRETTVVHDTIFVVEYDTIYVDEEEAEKLLEEGSMQIETIIDYKVDTVSILENSTRRIEDPTSRTN